MLAEPLVRAVERSRGLGRLGGTLAAWFQRAVPAGPVKDALAGTWLGHPAHPTLTDLPIGAWASALALDLLPDRRAARSADALVALGAVTAVPTAMSGLSELADITDERSRPVAALHALGNVAALALYAASLAARRRGARGAGRWLAGAGFTALLGSGFLGGHLAYRYGIGVNQTAFLHLPREWVPVMDEADLAEGKPQHARVGGVDLVLVRERDGLHALAARCSHRGGPLDAGEVREGAIHCPWHGSAFRLADGAVARGPASAPQPAYDVRVSGGRVEVRARR